MDMARRERVRQISERELGMLDILWNPRREFHQRLDSEGSQREEGEDLPGGVRFRLLSSQWRNWVRSRGGQLKGGGRWGQRDGVRWENGGENGGSENSELIWLSRRLWLLARDCWKHNRGSELSLNSWTERASHTERERESGRLSPLCTETSRRVSIGGCWGHLTRRRYFTYYYYKRVFFFFYVLQNVECPRIKE